MSSFSIKDLAELSGVKQHTIRIWEQRYSFLRPRRTDTAQRTYTVEELHVLLDVSLLHQNGHKISHIDRMTLEDKLQVISKIVEKQQKSVHELIIHMARMDPEGFEMVLDSCLIHWGIHETIKHIVFSFCDKVGLFQHASRNYVENIIVIKQIVKQKINLGIEKAAPPARLGKKVLLFSPYNEVNDMPLLYLQYLLKLHGFDTLNLGYMISVNSLETIHKQTKNDYFVTHLPKKTNHPDMAAFIENLRESHAQSKFIAIENNVFLEKNGMPYYKHVPAIIDAVEFLINECR